MIYKYTDDNSKCCVMGHLNRIGLNKPRIFDVYVCGEEGVLYKNKKIKSIFKNSSAIRNYTENFLESKKCFDISIVSINNGSEFFIEGKKTNETYKQIGPKKRVILFLEWMISEGW